MTRADLLAVFGAVILVALLYVGLWGNPTQGASARVWVDGVDQPPVSLHENRVFTVRGVLGDSTLEVRDGRVRFVASPCSGKVCIHTGWIHKTGEIAACLPNHVSVSIAGRVADYDAINF